MDDMGFYNYPDGSFYDADGYLFNTEGYDKFGGYYEKNVYIAPPNKKQHDKPYSSSQSKGYMPLQTYKQQSAPSG